MALAHLFWGDGVNDTPRGTFPKSAHLLKRADFRRVYEQGKRLFSGNMTVFYLHRAPQAEPTAAPVHQQGLVVATEPSLQVRIGFTVPRALGGAVQRNRIRRRTREAVRHNFSLLASSDVATDVVINPKKSVTKADFATLSQEVARAFTQVRQSAERVGRRAAATSQDRALP